MQYLKKITVAALGVGGTDAERIAQENGPTPIMRVYGRVKSQTEESSAIGPYLKFHGDFEAVNCVNGEKARAQNLILPEVAAGVVSGVLEAANAGGTEPGSASMGAQFGLEVLTLPHASAKGGFKFKYGVRSLLKEGTAPKDPLTLLGEQFEPVKLLTEQKSDKGKKR